ncbi:MAG: hypothetical protein QOJ82_1034 [Solirubrobacteraceae bacterium]|jgi:SAM-dependent methyltransferase|nr:hypothetical protein [Solirubrobacteraceae bacterium]
MLDRVRARVARRSFDYQWATLSEGEFVLGDAAFEHDVARIISAEELRVAAEWFAGRRVLDAGCGNGRWIRGFVELGCEVTAFDASAHGLQQVRARHGDGVRIVQGDVLRADELLAGERFDLVWCWGVLHHTTSIEQGIRSLARLVADDGLLYLYLYGAGSLSRRDTTSLAVQRVLMNALPFNVRRRLIERVHGTEKANQVFDAISTPLNRRVSFQEAAAMVRRVGLAGVTQTIPHTEVFLRAGRGATSAEPHFLPAPAPPFWFQRESAAAVS